MFGQILKWVLLSVIATATVYVAYDVMQRRKAANNGNGTPTEPVPSTPAETTPAEGT